MNEVFKKLLGNKWLLTLTAIGLLLLLYGATGGGGAAAPGTPHATAVLAPTTAANGQSGTQAVENSALTTAMAYEKYYDGALTKMLDQIQGVNDAEVMVTVDSTPVMEYGQNSTISRQSTVQSGSGSKSSTTTQSTQSTLVTVQNANGNQVPVVVAEQLPHIKGVLVVAKANDPVLMEAEIVNAVQDALGIPSYEITVLARK